MRQRGWLKCRPLHRASATEAEHHLPAWAGRRDLAGADFVDAEGAHPIALVHDDGLSAAGRGEDGDASGWHDDSALQLERQVAGGDDVGRWPAVGAEQRSGQRGGCPASCLVLGGRCGRLGRGRRVPGRRRCARRRVRFMSAVDFPADRGDQEGPDDRDATKPQRFMPRGRTMLEPLSVTGADLAAQTGGTPGGAGA